MPTDARKPGGFRQMTQDDRKRVRDQRTDTLAAHMGLAPDEAAQTLREVAGDEPQRQPNGHWAGRIHRALRGYCPAIEAFKDQRYGEDYIDGWKAECARPCGMSLNAMCRRKRMEEGG